MSTTAQVINDNVTQPANKKSISDILGLKTVAANYRKAISLHDGFIPTQSQIEKEEQEYKQLAMLGGGTLGLMALFGSAMVSNGLTLAILTSSGLGMLIIKMPDWFGHLMVEFDMVVDGLITAAMFTAYGTTVTGLIASGMTCILVSICLKWNRLRIYRRLVDGSKT